jgi:16S rRNA C967 or C1407 C5-methylase (RsmB/RsmF family)
MTLRNIKKVNELSLNDLEERFSKDVIEVFKNVYKNEWINALISITKPSRRYFIRINSMEIDKVMEDLRSEGLYVKRYPHINEAVYIDVEYLNYEKMPEFDGVVIADKYAAESVLEGAHLYAPGVLRMVNVKKNTNVAILDPFGAIIGIGIAKIDAAEFNKTKIRKGIVVNVTHTFYKIPSIRELRSYELGFIYPQSLPSMVAVKVLDPQPGETIVDMCAAPGGKISHIALLMRMQGQIYGFDRSENKVNKLKETLNRLNIKNVKVMVMDTRYLDLKMPELQADKVIIDPPCSALGVRPKLASDITFKKIMDYQQYQFQFLKSASKILKPKGILVFSVCTITPHEVEEIAYKAINELPFELDDQEPFIASGGSLKEYGFGKTIQRFHPHIDDTPGFSIIKMRKTN